eukprot:4465192-Ditylum_brightwellii.AAC.1
MPPENLDLKATAYGKVHWYPSLSNSWGRSVKCNWLTCALSSDVVLSGEVPDRQTKSSIGCKYVTRQKTDCGKLIKLNCGHVPLAT